MADDFITRYRALVEQGEIYADAAQAHVAEALQALHNQLEAYRPGNGSLLSNLLGKHNGKSVPQGLYIHGDVGRGKSMLMDLFYETAPIKLKDRVHFHEFMQEIHEAIHNWRQLHKKGAVKGDDPIVPVAEQIAAKSVLLCFDEFHVHDITDATILGRLFTALFDFGVVVVATSNRPPDGLYENGLNRGLFLPFIDLLKQRTKALTLDGDIDFRLNRLKGLEVYYAPLGADADKKMQQAWTRLTNAKQGAPCELPLKGRVVVVPQAAMGVARFSFAELCEQPLGPADYLKIAHNFHTVLIDRIPTLGKDNRNEAKRFVTLIDALYENKVKLIASAEAEPESLNPKGDHAFEFKRTASRLREMQSADYLALGHGQ